MLKGASQVVGICLSWVITVAAATAHPHVFVKGELSFLAENNAQLSAIEVTWRYDAFTTLATLAQLGLVGSVDQPLIPEAEDAILKDQLTWGPSYDGDSYLAVNGEDVSLAGPSNGRASIIDGELVVVFERRLLTPVLLRENQFTARMYDPRFYFSYEIAAPPTLNTEQATCALDRIKPRETDRLATLRRVLWKLGPNEDPSIPDVGALFAEQIILDCRLKKG